MRHKKEEGMLKKVRGWAVLTGAVLLTGCATTGVKNNQADIDALNARVTALQGQLADKDQEISKLQNQMSDERMAKDAAETALRRAEDEKRSLSDQLHSAESNKAKAYPSDLK